MVNNNPVNLIDVLGWYAAPGGGSTNVLEGMSESERRAWFAMVRDSILNDVKASSKRHCVPWRAVYSVVLNELADYTQQEANLEELGLGSTVGIGQNSMDTAQRIGYQRFDNPSFPVNRNFLRWDRGSIDVTAANLAHNLGQTCAGNASAAFTKFAGCDLTQICCALNCEQKYDYNGKDMGSLVKAMSALHNSHRAIGAQQDLRGRGTMGPDDPGNFPDAYSMGYFGESFYYQSPWQ